MNPAITENTECFIIKACAPVIDIKVGVSLLTWCITTLHFTISTSNVWLSFQAKNNVRSAPPLLALHLPKSRTEALMLVPQIITYVVVEK